VTVAVTVSVNLSGANLLIWPGSCSRTTWKGLVCHWWPICPGMRTAVPYRLTLGPKLQIVSFAELRGAGSESNRFCLEWCENFLNAYKVLFKTLRFAHNVILK